MIEAMDSKNQRNPFLSPTSDSLSDATGISVDFVPIMRRWDWLRLFYNAVLFIEVVALALFVRPMVFQDIAFIPAMCLGAAVANLCFTTGPAIEAYGTYYRVWHPFMTFGLYFVGLAISMVLAFGTVMGF